MGGLFPQILSVVAQGPERGWGKPQDISDGQCSVAVPIRVVAEDGLPGLASPSGPPVEGGAIRAHVQSEEPVGTGFLTMGEERGRVAPLPFHWSEGATPAIDSFQYLSALKREGLGAHLFPEMITHRDRGFSNPGRHANQFPYGDIL